MPACIYARNNHTGLLFGEGGRYFSELDGEIRHALGYAPNPERWLGDWFNMISHRIAMNVSPEVLKQGLCEVLTQRSKSEYQTFRENVTVFIEVYTYLRENYTFSNNWGESSNWKDISLPEL